MTFTEDYNLGTPFQAYSVSTANYSLGIGR